MGISHEPSAAYTQDQNGRAERIGGVVFLKDLSRRWTLPMGRKWIDPGRQL
jgi:hypothetical protein